MSELHYDEEMLFTYLENRGPADSADDLQEHLVHCSSCRRLFESVQEFFSCIGDSDVWGVGDLPLEATEPDAERLDEFLAHARRLSTAEALAGRARWTALRSLALAG